MAQSTETETSPGTPAEERVRTETHSAAPSPPSRPSNYFRRRPRARLFLIVAIVIVLVGGFFAWRYFSSYESTDDAQVDGHLMAISARISGYISKVNVDDNQTVPKGYVIAEIDPRDYQVAVDQARADVATAVATAHSLGIDVPVTSISTTNQVSTTEADVQDAEAGIGVALQQADAAQAQLLQAQANNVKAQNDLGRYKQLVEKQEISEQLYDQAVAAAAADSAAVSSAKASVAASSQQVAQARARLAQAQAAYRSSQTGPQQVASIRARALSAAATVKAKEAALEAAELNLQYTKVLAPADGVVTKNRRSRDECPARPTTGQRDSVERCLDHREF